LFHGLEIGRSLFNKKSQSIKWIPSSYETQLLVPPPSPAKKYIPQWYKDAPIWEDGNKEVTRYPDGQWDSNATFKKCLPFLDPYMNGYIQELWCDVTFYEKDGNLSVDYNSTIPPVEIRTGASYLDIGDGYYKQEFVWNTQWEPITPRGYSTLYTQPHNMPNLPLLSLTGIIDTDSWSVPGNYPFLVRKGFLGTIKAGTPIYQMMPFKREDWNSEVLEFSNHTDEKISKSLVELKKHEEGGYKKMHWNKKNYE
jgi:hypothetical protein